MGGVLLLSGIVIGAGGTGLFLKHKLDQPDEAPKHFSRRLADRITHDLALNPEQSEQIRTLFETHQEEMKTIRLKIKDEVDDSRETLQSEVKAILTPEQAEKWDQRIKEYWERPTHERGPGGGMHDGPGLGGGLYDGSGPRKRMRDGQRQGDNFDGRRPPPPRDGEHRPPPPRYDENGDRRPPPPRDDQGFGDQAPPPPDAI